MAQKQERKTRPSEMLSDDDDDDRPRSILKPSPSIVADRPSRSSFTRQGLSSAYDV